MEDYSLGLLRLHQNSSWIHEGIARVSRPKASISEANLPGTDGGVEWGMTLSLFWNNDTLTLGSSMKESSKPILSILLSKDNDKSHTN